MALVYLATNTVNGKKYVGFTRHTIGRRRWQHNYDASRQDRKIDTLFYRAIRKYGISAFTFEILEQGDDEAYLRDIVEPLYIEKLQTFDRNKGYNRTLGGEGHRGGVAWNKGLPRTQEVKDKLRIAHTGRKQSDETIQKRVEKIRGLKRSEETKSRMSSEWLITTPDGQELRIKNLQAFCRDNGLIAPNMVGVANGQRARHKGYTCKRLTIGPQSRR